MRGHEVLARRFNKIAKEMQNGTNSIKQDKLMAVKKRQEERKILRTNRKEYRERGRALRDSHDPFDILATSSRVQKHGPVSGRTRSSKAKLSKQKENSTPFSFSLPLRPVQMEMGAQKGIGKVNVPADENISDDDDDIGGVPLNNLSINE
jgi:hypothetical protein